MAIATILERSGGVLDWRRLGSRALIGMVLSQDEYADYTVDKETTVGKLVAGVTKVTPC